MHFNIYPFLCRRIEAVKGWYNSLQRLISVSLKLCRTGSTVLYRCKILFPCRYTDMPKCRYAVVVLCCCTEVLSYSFAPVFRCGCVSAGLSCPGEAVNRWPGYIVRTWRLALLFPVYPCPTGTGNGLKNQPELLWWISVYIHGDIPAIPILIANQVKNSCLPAIIGKLFGFRYGFELAQFPESRK